MSKRILVIGDSMSLAHVSRAIILAHRLIKEGAEVIFATGSSHKEIALKENFDVREIYCVSPDYALKKIRSGSHIFNYETIEHYVNSDLKLIKDIKPDLILGDMRLTLNISAELSGLPYWNIVSGYLTRYYSAIQSPPKTFPLVRLLGNKFSQAIYHFFRNCDYAY